MPSLTADIPKSGGNPLRPVSLFHKKLYCRRKASGLLRQFFIPGRPGPFFFKVPVSWPL